MQGYVIETTRETPPLDGAIEGTPWDRANRLLIDQFNWHTGGPKPLTAARFLYDDNSLYGQFHVEDQNISAEITELNGPTFQDSSVELFVDPNPDADTRYFNFEVNCCGQFKLGWQRDGWQVRDLGRDLIARELSDQIRVASSVDGPVREPRPSDEEWWVATEIPFSVLRQFTEVDIGPKAGTTWRGNVYRSGVERESMKATWNPMPTPEPDYHSPEYFGRLRFG